MKDIKNIKPKNVVKERLLIGVSKITFEQQEKLSNILKYIKTPEDSLYLKRLLELNRNNTTWLGLIMSKLYKEYVNSLNESKTSSVGIQLFLANVLGLESEGVYLSKKEDINKIRKISSELKKGDNQIKEVLYKSFCKYNKEYYGLKVNKQSTILEDDQREYITKEEVVAVLEAAIKQGNPFSNEDIMEIALEETTDFKELYFVERSILKMFDEDLSELKIELMKKGIRAKEKEGKIFFIEMTEKQKKFISRLK